MKKLLTMTVLALTILFSSTAYAVSGELIEGFSADMSDSITYLEKEIQTNPNNYRLRFILGTLYFDLGVAKVDTRTKDVQANWLLLDKAEKEFKEVLRIKKDDSMTYYYLGILTIQKGFNIKQSIEYFKRAIKSDGQNYRAYIKLHTLYLAEKQYKDALILLEDAKRNFNGNAEIYHRLSLTYLIIQDYVNVIENAEMALSLGKNTETQLILASAYSLTGNYDDAKKELEDVLNTDPKNRTALLGISVVFSKTGKKEKAIEILKKALIYYPDDSEIKKMLKELE